MSSTASPLYNTTSSEYVNGTGICPSYANGTQASEEKRILVERWFLGIQFCLAIVSINAK